jgi:hypothetical protein
MKSKDKLAVTVKKMPEYGGKLWAYVDFYHRDNSWIPSFEDLFRIVQALCYCEDNKYPNGRGRFMVRDFLKDCCEVLGPNETQSQRWIWLCQKYGLDNEHEKTL